MRKEGIAIIFPGQGAQQIGMGKDLYDNFEVAKRVFQEVDSAINQNLSDLIFYGNKEELDLTENAQPAIMACSIAAYKVLAEVHGAMSLSDLCIATAGHSLGEYTALCAAGSLTLSDTAKLLKIRGKSMQEAVPVGQGTMSALLGIDFDSASQIVIEAEKYGTCEIANDNCIGQIVISGDTKAVEYAERIASQYGCKRAIRLPVSAPFHCALMYPVEKIMSAELAKIYIAAPSVPVISNYTARPNLSPIQIAQLLVGQISNTVRWTESIELIHRRYNVENFIECGPGKILCGLVSRIITYSKCMNVGAKADLATIPKIV